MQTNIVWKLLQGSAKNEGLAAGLQGLMTYQLTLKRLSSRHCHQFQVLYPYMQVQAESKVKVRTICTVKR